MARELGTRRTVDEQAAWVKARFGIGSPPKTDPATLILVEEFPDDPDAHPEQARAAIAKAEAAGLRLGHGDRVIRPTDTGPAS